MLRRLIAVAMAVLLFSGSLLLNLSHTALAASQNLIANPSVETAASTSMPQSWLQGGWGTNTRSLTYLSSGHTGSHSVKTQITRYTSGDAKWYFAPVSISGSTTYQYSDYYQSTITSSLVAQVDDGAGNYSYIDMGTLPASSAWKTFQTNVSTPANAKNITIFHLIAAVGSLTIDDASLTPPAVVIPPTLSVSLASPSSGDTVNGKVSLTATVTSTNAVANVQFSSNGTALGTASNAPYGIVWDTTSVANGSYSLTALVTDTSGQTAVSSPVTVTVSNTVAPTPTTTNLVSNPSVEQTDASGANPLNWYSGQWGSNTAKFTYATTGHTGSHSLRIDMTKFASGGANWSYNPIPVTPGTVYQYSDYYQANTLTQVIAAVKLTNGTTQYLWLGNAYTSDGAWTKFYETFTAPAGAASVVVYQVLGANGYVQVDDTDLEPYVPNGFTNGLVTVTFDDGIASQYQNALPVMTANGIKGTFYIISSYLGLCNPAVSSICYMTTAQVQALATSGQEIGSHTVDHQDLTTISTSQVDTELSQSQSALQQLIGQPVINLAAPYGDVNLTVLNEAAKYYTTQRGTNAGYNDRSNFNKMNLLVQNVDSDITPAQVESYIDYAKATKTWLILVYHDINADTSVDPGYDTTPTDFATEMSYLKASGVATATLRDALAALSSQL